MDSRSEVRTTEAVFGGMPTSDCEWPMVAALDDECSGVLVHEELVLFAGHCGAELREAVFGPDVRTPIHRARLERCKVHPDAMVGGPYDFAYCWLDHPVAVPIVPVAIGCELSDAFLDKELTLVGFGLADVAGTFGTKRSGRVRISSVDETVLTSGGPGDGCEGDSGGPGFLQLSGSEWRLLAIQSAGLGDGCTGPGGVHAIAGRALEWLELETGLELSPCWDPIASRWDAGPRCQGFPANPDALTGADDACAVGDAVELPSDSCGKPFTNGTADVTAPRPLVHSPRANAIIQPGVDGTAPIHVAISVDEEDSGVRQVVAAMSDHRGRRFRRVREIAPFEFDIALPVGTWQLDVTARDQANNEGSSSVSFVVGNEQDAGCAFRPVYARSSGVLIMLLSLLVLTLRIPVAQG